MSYLMLECCHLQAAFRRALSVVCADHSVSHDTHSASFLSCEPFTMAATMPLVDKPTKSSVSPERRRPLPEADAGAGGSGISDRSVLVAPSRLPLCCIVKGIS